MKNNVITKRVHRLFSMLMLCLMIFSSTGSGAYAEQSDLLGFLPMELAKTLTIKVYKDDKPYPNAPVRTFVYNNEGSLAGVPNVYPKGNGTTDTDGVLILSDFEKKELTYEVRVDDRNLKYKKDSIRFKTDSHGNIISIDDQFVLDPSKAVLELKGYDKNANISQAISFDVWVLDKEEKPVRGVDITANIIDPKLSSYKTLTSDSNGEVKFELDGQKDGKYYVLTLSKNAQFSWEFTPEQITIIVYENGEPTILDAEYPVFHVTPNDQTHLITELKDLITEAKKYIDSFDFTNKALLDKFKKSISAAEKELAGETIPGYAIAYTKEIKEQMAELKKYENPKSVPNSSSVESTSRASVRPDTTTTIKNNDTPLAQQPTETQNAASINENTVAVLKINSLAYQVQENGKLVEKKSEVSPMIHQNRTMLPSRFIADLLGVGVEFDNASKTAKFLFESETNGKKEQNIAELTLGKNTMKFNGKEVPLSAEILNVNGRILLPMSDIQKAFKELGLNVDIKWNHETKTLFLEKIK